MEGIFEAFPDLLFVLDADGNILQYHAGKGFKFRVPPADFMGRSMPEILPPDTGRQFAQGIRQLNDTGEMVHLEFSLDVQGEERQREAYRFKGVIAKPYDVQAMSQILHQVVSGQQ